MYIFCEEVSAALGQTRGPQMEVKWTKISMKQDFEGNVVVTYENDEMILEITEGTMLVGGNLE